MKILNLRCLPLHLENSEESKFSYDAIKKFLGSNKIEYNDEGGWFKILIEENDSFLLINGLNPGKFIPEDGLLETQVMTLVYSFKPKANSVSAFPKDDRLSLYNGLWQKTFKVKY